MSKALEFPPAVESFFALVPGARARNRVQVLFLLFDLAVCCVWGSVVFRLEPVSILHAPHLQILEFTRLFALGFA